MSDCNPPWAKYQNDFDALSDAEIASESNAAFEQLSEAEDWLEAVALWDDAGRPRTQGASPGAQPLGVANSDGADEQNNLPASPQKGEG